MTLKEQYEFFQRITPEELQDLMEQHLLTIKMLQEQQKILVIKVKKKEPNN
jgi:hypothetical protein